MKEDNFCLKTLRKRWEMLRNAVKRCETLWKRFENALKTLWKRFENANVNIKRLTFKYLADENVNDTMRIMQIEMVITWTHLWIVAIIIWFLFDKSNDKWQYWQSYSLENKYSNQSKLLINVIVQYPSTIFYCEKVTRKLFEQS